MHHKEPINNYPNSQDAIQTLRTIHQNQAQLNLMADQKANILIGALVVVFTVSITRLVSISSQSHLIAPLLIFIVMQLIPLVLATLVLIPKNISKQQLGTIKNIRNPLFFGYFTRFSQNEYETYLFNQLTDNAHARSLLIRDIYQIGCILRRKYTLIRMAYIGAVMGVVVPVIYLMVLYINGSLSYG